MRHAVNELGFKVIMLSGTVPRRVPTNPTELFVDTIGLDSPYDYEPRWKTCIDLHVAVTDHGGSWYWPDRLSPTNMIFNPVGHFAKAFTLAVAVLYSGAFRGGTPTFRSPSYVHAPSVSDVPPGITLGYARPSHSHPPRSRLSANAA